MRVDETTVKHCSDAVLDYTERDCLDAIKAMATFDKPSSSAYSQIEMYLRIARACSEERAWREMQRKLRDIAKRDLLPDKLTLPIRLRKKAWTWHSEFEKRNARTSIMSIGWYKLRKKKAAQAAA